MKNFFRTAINFFLIATILMTSLSFAAAEDLPTGAGVYLLNEPTGVNQSPIEIYYYRPKKWKSGDKIFVAFHGSRRHASGYINGLQTDAERQNCLLICPEFTREKYPGSRYYNYGNVRGGKNYDKLNPADKWTFTAVNRIIDDVKRRTNSRKSEVIFFGHSAGSQFMHRYLFFAEEIKADLVIAANAGFYIMPDEKIKYPHGLKNTPIGETELKRAYAQKTIIMLGEKDTRLNEKFLRSPNIAKQGKHRLERGKNFFAQSEEKAAELGTEFNWKLVTVPNVGHSPVKMAKYILNRI